MIPAHDNFRTADGTTFRVSTVAYLAGVVQFVDWHSFRTDAGCARGPYGMGTCSAEEWQAMKAGAVEPIIQIAAE